MNKTRGQSAVEFALMAPIIFFMIFGMIYGGIMFMEYLHYSNAVRTAAREIAVSNATERKTLKGSKETYLKELWSEGISVALYKPTPKITYEEGGDVVIDVTFERVGSLPLILDKLDFPPKYIKALSYKMKLEHSNPTTTPTEDDDGDGDGDTGG